MSGGAHYAVLSLMRFDVYLMYSEATTVGYGSPQSKATTLI